jgi:hypothetical protein
VTNYWLQGFIVGFILWGIILFLFGVRGKDDFLQFVIRFNKKRSSIKGVLIFLLPPVLVGFITKFVLNRQEWFFRLQTLIYLGILLVLIGIIWLARKINWKKIWTETKSRLRFRITPLQFFLALSLVVFSVVLVWFLVGAFWIFTDIVVWSIIIFYAQIIIIYFLGNYIVRKIEEAEAEKAGRRYIPSQYLRFSQYHLLLFISLNVLLIGGIWYFVGEFLFFSNLVVYTIIGFYSVIMFVYFFGRYLMKMAETSEEIREIVHWISTHKTDLIFGAFFASLGVLWFIFQDGFTEWWVGGRRIWTSAIVGLVLLVYILIKVSQIGKFNIFESLLEALSINRLSLTKKEENRIARRFRRKLLFTYIRFFVKIVVIGILVGLIAYYWESVSAALPREMLEYRIAFGLIISIFIVWGTVGGFLGQLATLRGQESALLHYERRKRTLLMLELEDLKKDVQEERERLSEIQSENIQAAIELLKRNGYQIIIGPETKILPESREKSR